MSEEDEEVLAVLDNLDGSLGEIEKHLAPLLEKNRSLKDLSAQISHLENAKKNNDNDRLTSRRLRFSNQDLD